MSDGSLVEAFCFRFCLIFTVSDCYTLALGIYVVIFKVCSVSGNVGRSLLGFSFTGLYCELGWLSRVLLFCFLYRRRHHAAGLGHPGARPARGLPTGQGPTERVLRTDRHGHPLALGQGNHLPGVCLCVSVCVSEFLIDRITLPSQPKCHGWRLFGREREREREGERIADQWKLVFYRPNETKTANSSSIGANQLERRQTSEQVDVAQITASRTFRWCPSSSTINITQTLLYILEPFHSEFSEGLCFLFCWRDTYNK